MAFPPDLESYHHDRNITNPSINQSITSTTQHPTEHLSLPAFRTQHERCSTLPVNKQKLNRHTRISAIQLLTRNQNSAASSPRPLNTSPVNLHSHPPDPHRLHSNRVPRTAARKTQADHLGYSTRPGVQSLLYLQSSYPSSVRLPNPIHFAGVHAHPHRRLSVQISVPHGHHITL